MLATVSMDRSLTRSPAIVCSASKQIARLSSDVKGTNGKTAVTRERIDAWNVNSQQSRVEEYFESFDLPPNVVTPAGEVILQGHDIHPLTSVCRDACELRDAQTPNHGRHLTSPTRPHSEHRQDAPWPRTCNDQAPRASTKTIKSSHRVSSQFPETHIEVPDVCLYRRTLTSRTTTHRLPSLLMRNSANVHVVGA